MSQILVKALRAEKPVPLFDISGGLPVVMELWKSECPKCPAAIANLAAKVHTCPAFLFMAVNIDDNVEYAEMMQETHPGLYHVTMEAAMKDELKAQLGFTHVPYYIVVDSTGYVLHHGKATDNSLFEFLKTI